MPVIGFISARSPEEIGESQCRLLADFVAEVGDDKSVAAGANFLS
jgi:hypothetical protein